MATDTVLIKRTMLEAFKQKAKPTLFLSSWFQTPPKNITNKKKVVIDVKRNEEMIAVDVIRSTGGNLNNSKRFTTKEYEPPMYDEYAVTTADELLDRLPGMTEYATVSEEFNALAMAEIQMGFQRVNIPILIIENSEGYNLKRIDYLCPVIPNNTVNNSR